jgi:hypothetical protein
MPAYIGTGGGGGMKHPTGGTIGTPTGGGTGLSGQGWLDGAEVGGFKGTDSGSGVESNRKRIIGDNKYVCLLLVFEISNGLTVQSMRLKVLT